MTILYCASEVMQFNLIQTVMNLKNAQTNTAFHWHYSTDNFR